MCEREAAPMVRDLGEDGLALYIPSENDLGWDGLENGRVSSPLI